MRMIDRIRLRLRSLFRRDRLERELDDEMRFHLEALTRQGIARGLTPEQARSEARRQFGGVVRLQEDCRDKRGTRWLEDFAGDLKHALRSIRLNPKYSITLIGILAVCLGANMAVFSIVYSVLLRPLPAPEADRIVLMANRYPKAESSESGYSASGDYFDRIRRVTALQDHAMFNYAYQILESESASERIRGMVATPSLFKLLRVAPAFGRTFDEAEGEPGAAPTVILSHALWRNRFAADSAIAGRQVRMGGRPFTVVGVMPEGFLFCDPEVRFWMPLVFTAVQRQFRHSNNGFNIGRLKPGATVAQAQSQVNAINAANLETAGDLRELLISAGFETRVQPLKDFLTRDAKGSLELLWVAALLVLLIGALNAAGLVAARTSVRRREMGTRLALGAGLRRLASQITVENLVLAFLGGAVGLAIAHVLASSLATVGLDRFPRATEVQVGPMTAAFGLAGAVLAGLIIAAVSILHLSRLSVSSALADFSRSSTAGRSAGLTRKGLVVAQVSAAFVLLMGSAVLLASFRELLRVAPGFDTDGILTASTLAPSARYAGAPELASLMNRYLTDVRSIPGVVSAGATSAIPLQSIFNRIVIFPEGYVSKAGESPISPIQIVASDGYMEAMGIRLAAGRYFDQRDTATSQPVVLIDKQLAGRFWPGQSAVGRRMFMGMRGSMQPGESTRWLTVVGVIENARMERLTGTAEQGVYYFPASQAPLRTFTLAIKTRGEPESVAPPVRAALARIDPLLAMFDVQTMHQRVGSSLASRRAALTLSLAFGAISLLLAWIGLFGVLSYLLMQRRREIAVRMAVGCTPGQAFRLFLNEGAILTGAGLMLGGIAAFAGRSIADKFAYGVKPFDPLVLGFVVLTLVAVAFMATALPARQAARVDPAAALAEQ